MPTIKCVTIAPVGTYEVGCRAPNSRLEIKSIKMDRDNNAAVYLVNSPLAILLQRAYIVTITVDTSP